MIIVILFLLLVASVVGRVDSRPSSPTIPLSSQFSNKSKALLLDVDNTLYDEKLHRIEAQIVKNIHRFVTQAIAEFKLNQQHESIDTRNLLDTIGDTQESATLFSEKLHSQYGSTIEGLRQTLWKDSSPQMLREKKREFYDSVYSNIDCRSLLQLKPQSSYSLPVVGMGPWLVEKQQDSMAEATNIIAVKTGYNHDATTAEAADFSANALDRVRRLLQSIAFDSSSSSPSSSSNTVELHLASNSPLYHVQRVIQASGLASIPWTRVWTPDGNTANLKTSFPTKLHPQDFYCGSDFFRRPDSVSVLDDSLAMLQAMANASENLIQTIRINSCSSNINDGLPLSEAMGMAMGWQSSTFQFDDVRYLQSKNVIDRESIHRETWMKLIDELTLLLVEDAQSLEHEGIDSPEHTSSVPLTIVDLGAGILPMLRLILMGSSDSNNADEKCENNPNEDRLPSIITSIRQRGVAIEHIQYYAYEPNQGLESSCVEQLYFLGFGLQSSQHTDNGKEMIFTRHPKRNEQHQQPTIYVTLRFWDFQRESLNNGNQHDQRKSVLYPHLIVGCCFADLLEPYDLSSSIMRCFLSESPNLSTRSHAMVYFPITFAGVTQFLPPQPFESARTGSNDVSAMLPSDTKAFALYSKALVEKSGHNLDPDKIALAMAAYGATMIGRGRSDWVIDPHTNQYMWNTMLYFFGTLAGPALQADRWDAQRWLDRARQKLPKIHASNLDLLFRMPPLGEWKFPIFSNNPKLASNSENGVATHGFYSEILFAGPRQVTTKRRRIPKTLQPDEIRIIAEFSLISTGTELKVFEGRFDEAVLDVNIKGMDTERMAYPLSYGYSLVGRVVECGARVMDASTLVGKRVFSFSPHASQVVTLRSAVQLVPDDVTSIDAVFMPAVETALSLVQDARPVMGEKIAVFGQGLIGLLVTGLLQQFAIDMSSNFGTISTFDMLPDRLAASATMGASQALLPTEAIQSGPFDLSIEVSGNGRALQAAIDSTRPGGRIVIGSWYGNEDVALKLGIDFHRSHKSLMTSQVSSIPAILTKTWTKDRRFTLAWHLVRIMRPSRLVTRRLPLDCAQAAYEELEKGRSIATVFDYLFDAERMNKSEMK